MSSPTDVSPFAAATAAVLEGLLDEPPLTRAEAAALHAAGPGICVEAPGLTPLGLHHAGQSLPQQL